MEFAVPWSTTTCNSCRCVDGGRACDICIHFNFSCRGTCRCCVKSRWASHSKSRGQGPSTSRGQGPSTSRGQGPSTSRGQGPSSVKRNPDSLCTECNCCSRNVPCRKCTRSYLKCRGTCPCCDQSQRSLNPHTRLESDPICPRCTRTPGEGSCAYCRKVAEEENAAALARFKARHCHPPKPAILQHKKKNLCNTSTVQAKDVYHPQDSDAESVKLKEMIKCYELRMKNQNSVKDEYCLHCQCRRGSEPCMACSKAPCYGNCECCKEFNWRLLDREQLMANTPESRQSKDWQGRRHATVPVPTDDSLPSTSGLHVDHSYPQSLKCELCDCYKYSRPCENCSDNNMGCIFTGDSKICLCCTIKLMVL